MIFWNSFPVSMCVCMMGAMGLLNCFEIELNHLIVMIVSHRVYRVRRLDLMS